MGKLDAGKTSATDALAALQALGMANPDLTQVTTALAAPEVSGELVEDRSTREPFDPSLKLHAKVKKAAMARGLMVYPMGGTIDGQRGDHVLLAPPFIVTEEQIGDIVDRLGSAIDDALAQGR